MTRTLDELSAAWDAVITQQESRNWDLGDIALEVETGYGDGALQEFAHVKDVAYSTMSQYRWVASRFENFNRLKFSWTVHHIFASLEDRVEAMRSRETWTTAEAREYVGKRKNVVASVQPSLNDACAALERVSVQLSDYPPNEVQARELAVKARVAVELAWKVYGTLVAGNVDDELQRLVGGAL